jgi:ROS/MUCR transcriptional regulator protein
LCGTRGDELAALPPAQPPTRHVEGVLRRRYVTLKARAKTPPAFKTRRDIERYFGGKMIECLLCRQRFRRLGGHLAAKHEMSVDEYRSQFGLPWTRGLTSAASVASSGWTDERKAKARKLARINRFFERAHLTPRRVPAPFLQTEAVQNLGKHAVGFGKAFERRVRALFDKGFTDAAIARALDVGRATVTYRTMHWRKRKRFK